MESFFVSVKSYSISPVRSHRIMKKALFPRLLRSLLITYSGKRKYSIVLVKSLKKSWILDPKICTNTAHLQMVRFSKGCVFWGESKNGFVISYGFFVNKKRKIRKRIIYHDNGMSSCSSQWKEKRGKTNWSSCWRQEGKATSMNYVWIYEMHIFRFQTQTFLR